MSCSNVNIPERLCALEEATQQLLATGGHPPVVLTNMSGAFEWDTVTQMGNIPPVASASPPVTEVVVVADAAARAAAAPTDLNRLLIQTTDVINGNFSLWAATGLSAGNWTLKTGSLAAQNVNSVSITGGTITGISPLAVTSGGTGASTKPQIRQNLTIPALQPTLGVIDWFLSPVWYDTLNANQTFTFLNAVNGLRIDVAIYHPAGELTTWPSNVAWVNNVPPIPPAANTKTLFKFIVIDGSIYGSYGANYPLV